MSLTPLARKYKSEHAVRPGREAALVEKVAGLTNYSRGHIYNVLRGVRKSAALSRLIEDVRAGRLNGKQKETEGARA